MKKSAPSERGRFSTVQVKWASPQKPRLQHLLLHDAIVAVATCSLCSDHYSVYSLLVFCTLKNLLISETLKMTSLLPWSLCRKSCSSFDALFGIFSWKCSVFLALVSQCSMTGLKAVLPWSVKTFSECARFALCAREGRFTPVAPRVASLRKSMGVASQQGRNA